MAWTGTGSAIWIEAWFAEAGRLRIDGKDDDVVIAEIVDDQESVVGGEHGAMGVGGVLAGGVRTVVAEGGLVEVEALDGVGEGAVRANEVAGDGTAGVVGYEDGTAACVDRDVAWASACGRDLSDQSEGAGGGIDEVGGDRGGLGARALVGCVEQAAITDLIDGEIGRAETLGGERGLCQLACGEVEAGDVDALGAGLVGVCAEVDKGPWSRLRGGLRLAGEEPSWALRAVVGRRERRRRRVIKREPVRALRAG